MYFFFKSLTVDENIHILKLEAWERLFIKNKSVIFVKNKFSPQNYTNFTSEYQYNIYFYHDTYRIVKSILKVSIR